MDGGSTVAQSLIQISPTYLSTDLLTHNVLERKKFPVINVTQLPTGAKCWGSEATTYGGVGKLPFLGETSTEGKLVLSRSHCHYSGGVNTYHAPSQPYAVTSLSKAACRINDELLPKPLITTHAEDIKKKEPWPEHPFTSHLSKFDVFPRFDPGRTEYDVPVLRHDKQELTENTVHALEKLSETIYCTTHYQRTLLPWNVTSRPIDAIKIHRHDTTEDRHSIDLQTLAHAQCEEGEVQREEDLEEEDEGEKDDGKEADEDGERGTKVENTNRRDENRNQCSTEKCGLKKPSPHKKKHKVDGMCPLTSALVSPNASATWPSWPPGNSNLTTHPPGYPKILLPHYLPKRFCVAPSKLEPLPDCAVTSCAAHILPTSCCDRDQQRPASPASLQRVSKQLDRAVIPSCGVNGTSRPRSRRAKSRCLRKLSAKYSTQGPQGSAGETNASTYGTCGIMNINDPGCRVGLRLSTLGGKSFEFDDTGSLVRDRLYRWPTKLGLPAVVGVRFKTDAHLRYHRTHPDMIPDLRHHTTSGKQHFFFGTHASIIR